MTWPESVDEALCFGWIDGVRKRIDDEQLHDPLHAAQADQHLERHQHRQGGGAQREGRMRTAGLAAFARRKENRSGIYSYEQRPQELPPEYRQVLDRSRAAAKDFDSRPPWYRRTAIWKIVSAKTEATRLRRLRELIDCHARGETIAELRRTSTTKKKSR